MSCETTEEAHSRLIKTIDTWQRQSRAKCNIHCSHAVILTMTLSSACKILNLFTQ